MATLASTTLLHYANPIERMRRAFLQHLAGRSTLDFAAELALVQRRLEALQGSAPTWHPLHLERVVSRTVIQPLQAIHVRARRRTAEGIEDVLLELRDLSKHSAAVLVLGRATLLLREVRS